MKNKHFLTYTGLILIVVIASLSFNYIKPSIDTNYVPDAKTAKRIAEALWGPIYGEDKIENEKPFTAELKEGVWIVQGTLKGSNKIKGGTAYIEIRQSDCKVLKLTHYK